MQPDSFITVRFIASSGFIGRGIRAVTGSLFSHVEFGAPEGTWIGAHASGGVQERPADYCQPIREYVYEIPCTRTGRDNLLTWARAQVGTKYNFFDIVGLLIQNRDLTSAHRYICSQFGTVGLLKLFGARRVLNVQEGWTYRITPETLHLSPLFVGNLVSKKG